MKIKMNGILREKICIYLRMAIFFLTLAAIILGAICLILNAQFKRVTHEAGDTLLASDIMRGESVSFGEDYDPDCLSRPGVYFFTVTNEKREIKVRLKVVDTKAPEIKVKNVLFAIEGSLPTPEDFVDTAVEADSFTGEFMSDIPEIKAPGKYEMKVRYSDPSGNKTEIFEVLMTLIYDTEPPKLTLSEDKTVFVGETVDYYSMVSVTDNCVGEIELVIDSSEVNVSEAGEYYVYFTAKDQSSNQCERARAVVRVIARGEDETE